MRILDIGCGDCRVFKEVDFSFHTESADEITLVGADIFYEGELPDHFRKELKERNINYKKLSTDKYGNTIVDCRWGKFDIITSLGVDCHLVFPEKMIETAIDNLNDNGILIWQMNKQDTWKGKRLQWSDRKLKYKYHNIDPYKDMKYYTSCQSTKISHILTFKKYAK